MSLTTLTVDELYKEIADLARDQGVSDQETWDGLVEEVMESHLDTGEMDADEDSEGMGETLRAMWSEYRRESAEESQGPEEDVGEDFLHPAGILGQTKDEEV